MRSILPVAVLALCAGCSTVSNVRDAWTWDATRTREGSRAQVLPQDLAALTSRLADLQVQRNEIRSRISAEPDIGARQGLYAQLHRVGRQLSPLERELAATALAR